MNDDPDNLDLVALGHYTQSSLSLAMLNRVFGQVFEGRLSVTRRFNHIVVKHCSSLEAHDYFRRVIVEQGHQYQHAHVANPLA